MSALRTVIEAFKAELSKGRSARSGARSSGRAGGRARRNPWPKCPACFHRVPALCDTAEPPEMPCGNGLTCGCCQGPHKPPKPAAGTSESDKILHPAGDWS